MEGSVGYTEAKAVGDRGEAIVAQLLERYRGAEAVVLHDLLFDSVDTTTQVDHILIDRFGLLLVETKFYNALIKGTSDDRTWTACYKDGGRRQFHNPLRQNEGHRLKLLRVLQQHGIRLDSSYTQSLIVFANGHIGDLTLTAEDRARVLDPTELNHHLATRHDFAPNGGDLNASQIASIATIVSSLDRSGDSAVQARHERMVKEASRRRPARSRRTMRRTVPRGPRKPSTPSRHESPVSLSSVLVIVLVAAAIMMGPTLLDYLRAVIPQRPAANPVVPQPAPPLATPPSVPDALARLREADPEIAHSLVDPDNPALSTVNGYPTYTWQYTRKDGAQAVSIRRLSVSFDQSGRIVGVSED